MKYSLIVLASLLAPLFSQAGAKNSDPIACAKEGVNSRFIFSGTLSQETNIHPNGSRFTSLILSLPEPGFCYVTEETAVGPVVAFVKEVQLNPMDLSVAETDLLNQKAGQKVTVSGEFYAAHTAWHIRPLVVVVKSLK